MAAIQYLELSLPTAVVVVDHGTDMQVVLVDLVVVEILDQTVQDLTITLDPMTAVIKTWADEELKDRDFQADQELDLIVRLKTVTDLVAVVVQVALDSAVKTIVVWDRPAMEDQAQQTTF
jgi:hypothetical protein